MQDTEVCIRHIHVIRSCQFTLSDTHAILTLVSNLWPTLVLIVSSTLSALVTTLLQWALLVGRILSDEESKTSSMCMSVTLMRCVHNAHVTMVSILCTPDDGQQSVRT